jgi:hypothetical protein
MSTTPDLKSIAFNVAGGGVLLVVAGYMAYSYFTTPAILACTSRYPAGQQFTLRGSSGKPMSTAELQGRTGSREWGLLKNAKVLAGEHGESLEVTLASTETEEEETASQNGVGFVWPIRELGKASGACLSYGVFLPQGFAFKEAGLLPGLYGASDISQIDELAPEDSFATRMGWSNGGDVGVDVRAPARNGYWEAPSRKKIWSTGRWVRVEQEIALNAPGQTDGALRIWIDGALTINRTGLMLRKSHLSGLSGVVSDIGYARTLSDVAALRVSPFVVQWQ